MKKLLKDFKNIFKDDANVVVEVTFGKGYEWADLLTLPEDESIWEEEVISVHNTETSPYDLIVQLKA